MVHVLKGLAAIRIGARWIAWNTSGPIRGTESKTPEESLKKAEVHP